MTPFDELELTGIDETLETLGLILTILTLGGLILTVLGLVYAVRTWMAQSAAFKTRQDVADIKRMLEDMREREPSAQPPAKRPEPISDGPVIAQNVDRPGV